MMATLVATLVAIRVQGLRFGNCCETGCTAWVFGMVAWGGLTRLTESGLSMTSWRFAGTKWPATEEEWQQEFHAYQVLNPKP